MQFVPYLNFDGNCAEAMAFYTGLFGGQVVHQSTFGEMPPDPVMPPLPASAQNRLMHAQLQIGAQSLMASDTMPATPGADPAACAGGYRKPQGLWVSIGVEAEAEGRRVFDGLAAGGEVSMPFGKTFWSAGFGMVTDRFGTPWMVNVAAQAQADGAAAGNPVVWFEIYVQDMARARRFYEAVFQCQLSPLPAPPGEADGVQMLSFPAAMGAPGAAGMLVQMQGVPTGGGGTLVYFACEDCAVEQARAVAAGGQVHKAKFAIGTYGHIALVLDTEGNCIGLHSMR